MNIHCRNKIGTGDKIFYYDLNKKNILHSGVIDKILPGEEREALFVGGGDNNFIHLNRTYSSYEITRIIKATKK